MKSNNSYLQKNSIDRWVLENFELTSGDSIDLLIDGHWIQGTIEFWTEDYYWFSKHEGVPVILNSNLKARRTEGRNL